MFPTAKQVLTAAVDDALVTCPSFALLYRLTGSAAAAEGAMSDVRQRRRLATPVRKYLGGLSEAQAQRVVDAAHHTPARLHPLHEQIRPNDLLAVALIALSTASANHPTASPDPVPPEY